MQTRENVLLIGGAGRKAGKTAFACRVIRGLAARRPVIGVKITPFHEGEFPAKNSSEAADPGGRREAPLLIEEKTASPSTDTGRMLEAGAQKAFWLRAREEKLEEGIRALFSGIPEGACVVAEGSSARKFFRPGIFLLLREAGKAEAKPSFAALLPLADRVALFDGTGWDFPPEKCLFIDGRWLARPEASAIILAGGDSRRMGRDKALLPFEGRPLIARVVERLAEMFEDIVIGANRVDEFTFLGREVVPDREPGRGPLMGIASALPRAKHDLAFVTACDIPSIDLHFVRDLIDQAQGYDMVLPYTGDRKYEPLFAVYRKSVVEPALEILSGGGKPILALLDRVAVRLVEARDAGRFGNINTPADLSALNRRRAADESGSLFFPRTKRQSKNG